MIRAFGTMLCCAAVLFCVFYVIAVWAGLDIKLVP